MLMMTRRNKNLSYNGLSCSGRPERENKIKQKHRQILGSCQTAEKAMEHERTVIPVIVGALAMATKDLGRRQEELEIRRRIKTNQITILLRSSRIFRRVLESLLSHRLQ